MGGGADSRIPSILSDFYAGCANGAVRVVCHTYDFDPEFAQVQIKGWLEEYKPDLVIGESLGSLHALRVHDRPVLLVSPALNTPFFFGLLSWLTWIPGVKALFEYIYKPKEGDRQRMDFSRKVLRKYCFHGQEALLFGKYSDSYLHAFFGVYDHYRRSGVVSLRMWKKVFGANFTLYEGTHFMEEEYIYSLLIPKINEVLGFDF